jgi:hypothetical protein
MERLVVTTANAVVAILTLTAASPPLSRTDHATAELIYGGRKVRKSSQSLHGRSKARSTDMGRPISIGTAEPATP